MKVITEERLREKLNKQIDKIALKNSQFINDPPSVENIKAMMLAELINELQELDTLTVTRLRPMCDAPRDEQILIKLKKSDGLMTVGKIDSHTPTIIWRSSHSYCVIDDSEGWQPMPRYEPEKV